MLDISVVQVRHHAMTGREERKEEEVWSYLDLKSSKLEQGEIGVAIGGDSTAVDDVLVMQGESAVAAPCPLF